MMNKHNATNGENVEQATTLRQALVDDLKRQGFIRTPHVEAAFRTVPRHVFLPDVPLDHVYQDKHFITKEADGKPVSSSSQPAIMAIMLEQLHLEPGLRVLEIGAGTGYNAALIAQIVGAAGHLVTLDIDDDIVQQACAHLVTAGFPQVEVICRDGALGYLNAAPYDRIILTVGAWDIVPAWWEQLKPGGRLVLPLVLRGPLQAAVSFVVHDGYLESDAVAPCGFMPLRGTAAAPQSTDRVALGPQPGYSVLVHDATRVDADELYQVLMGPSTEHATHVRLTPAEVAAFHLWLALHEAAWCELQVAGPLAQPQAVPYLFGIAGSFAFSEGILDGPAICVFTQPRDKMIPMDHPFAVDASPIELAIRSYSASEELIQRLLAQLTAWDAAGRPAVEQVRIRVNPLHGEVPPRPNTIVLRKQWSQLVLDWLAGSRT